MVGPSRNKHWSAGWSVGRETAAPEASSPAPTVTTTYQTHQGPQGTQIEVTEQLFGIPQGCLVNNGCFHQGKTLQGIYVSSHFRGTMTDRGLVG